METLLNADQARRPSLTEARAVAGDFLARALPDVQRIDITRVAPLSLGEAVWEAEADVWQPNPTLKSLGLETDRPVLDHSRYLIRLDALLNVLEYELEGAVRGG
jgi:hypothetical protein